MEFAFPWPMTQGEWLAWSSAAVTVAFGIILLFCTQPLIQTAPAADDAEHPEALSEGRATMSGFYLGVGLSCILLVQPLLYLALGFSWLFTAFGRIVSMLSDRGNTLTIGFGSSSTCFWRRLRWGLRSACCSESMTLARAGWQCDNSAGNACPRTCCGLQKPVLDGNRLSTGDAERARSR